MPRDIAPTPFHGLPPSIGPSRPDERDLVTALIAEAALGPRARARIAAAGADLVTRIRSNAKPGLMEVFLAEYGLSTDEGVALMCLAEALLRVPDAPTMDALIEDKIAPGDWGRHLGRSASSLVNASTWALMLTGRVLEERGPGLAGTLRAAVKRLGEPVIRAAVARAMKEMGRQFVLGETIEAAMTRATLREVDGFTYSYDMLGEAARTDADARHYLHAYGQAIAAIADACTSPEIARNPGISVKLSALHPRYEVAQAYRVMAELVPRVTTLARQARAAGMGFNIDAEEAERLDLSLSVIEAVLADPALAGWDGFGVVVQAYGRRAGPMIDRLTALAERLDRRIMVRLVKGAYWDTEVKRAQVLGLDSFPVFTRKAATDVSYITLARRLLSRADRLYPQFATHNAHTVAAVLDLASTLGVPPDAYEFQRLHGMGETLHDIVLSDHGTRCRIYAPVGEHRDLLAYLVRRLLENGANSSFVNRVVDASVPAEAVAACPFEAVEGAGAGPNPGLPTGTALFGARANARGWDTADANDLATLDTLRAPFRDAPFAARPRLAGSLAGGLHGEIVDPATLAVIGHVISASLIDVETALSQARRWDAPAEDRAVILRRAADLYETHTSAILVLLAREAGKTLADAIAELREAVDFLRYYADGAERMTTSARGVFACISPWNFPLAIFTGQIAAALATGNAVLAKPAPQTPLIADLAVDLLLRAGVPPSALQLLPGGTEIGATLTRDPRVNGVAFTGSTATARAIRQSMAEHLSPTAPLIAETGGINAMIVDSTALPEQAVRDILAGAFQSAGQRCSALRCLYVQEDIAAPLLQMLQGAMDELAMGDPWQLSTDVGPVIDAAAAEGLHGYIATARAEGRLIHALPAPAVGHLVGPAMIRVNGIADIPREVFGPVLHVATFHADDLDAVIGAINATGQGLTFGLHTRIDARVARVTEAVHAGNLYVNRNQIGAVVGSQPFGGEGLSGTGPKAGGPHYLARFVTQPPGMVADLDPDADAQTSVEAAVQRALALPRAAILKDAILLPGPTGESNLLSSHARAPMLCLGPGAQAAQAQMAAVAALGGHAVAAAGLAPEALERLAGFGGALWWGSPEAGRPFAQALARRPGPILPLIGTPDEGHVRLERHVCIDTTASGGNADLLAADEG